LTLLNNFFIFFLPQNNLEPTNKKLSYKRKKAKITVFALSTLALPSSDDKGLG